MKTHNVIARYEAILNLFNAIYWFFYKLTPIGKREWTLLQGLKGFEENKKEANIIKWGIINNATKKFKTKKILAFAKGESIAKPKKTNHQVIEASKNENKEALDKAKLKINQKGQFINA